MPTETVTFRGAFAMGLVDRLTQSLRAAGQLAPPTGRFRFALEERVGPEPARYDPKTELVRSAGTRGLYMFTGEVKSSVANARTYELAAGNYRWRIESDYYVAERIEVSWPPHIQHFVDVLLMPNSAYPLTGPMGQANGVGPTAIRGNVFDTNAIALESVIVRLERPLVR